MKFYLLRQSSEERTENQTCYSTNPEQDFPNPTVVWSVNKPLPEFFVGPVHYEIDELISLDFDYHQAINASLLVSDRLSLFMQKQSSYIRAYPAEIFHKGKLIRSDVKALHFEQSMDCVDEGSEIESLDIGDGVEVPVRYRRFTIARNKLPSSENIFKVELCQDLIVSERFKEEAKNEGFMGLSFFDFEDKLL